jgi:signal transduction histidine kinase
MKLVFQYIIRIRIALLVGLVISLFGPCFAASPYSTKPATCDYNENAPILIITSYNPDTRLMAENLTAFMEQFHRRGFHRPVMVETMNCKNLSEAPEWKPRMAKILDKYSSPDRRPSLIILYGQEAWGAYLAQTSEIAQTTPSLCGMGSDVTLEMPPADTLLADWNPVCRDVQKDFPQFNIVGGYLYHYDVSTNLALIRRFYPQRHHLLFLSDNSFGGLIMQAYVRREMATQLQPGETVQWLDGRKLSITDVTATLREQGDSSVVMVGTWRVDCTENYVMGNITHLLNEANTHLPAFSLSSVGVGDWAIGGYMPVYQIVGDKLANLAMDYLTQKKRPEGDLITALPSHYVFDYQQLGNFRISTKQLPAESQLVNRPMTFIEEHLMLVIVVLSIILILSLSCGIAIYYLLRVNRMNVKLEEMSKDLIAAKDKAEEANRLKSAFLANMSHEIRTPLNAIVGFSSVLVNEDITDKERAQFCDIIRVNSDLLLHLINDILDLSRIESGRMQFVMEPVEVVDLCNTALATSECARRTDAIFSLETRLTRLTMNTDGQRLQQVLINLLSNAAKFTPKGFITLRLEADTQQRIVTFTVEDTGCGIPPEKAERVFERFEKLDEYAQGTGLGLSISKVIVERLGGRIWVDTSYQEGARFIFTLPLGDDCKVED